MKYVRMVALICMGAAVSGCATTDIASRNAPFEAPSAAAMAPSMSIASYQVRVPQSLKVSEANLYYPPGDIVWREDPLGDRHVQVQKIFEQSLARAEPAVKGKMPVRLDIEVTRFHALSEKTRYTIGGRHSIHFVMNFLDPETGAPIAPPREIDATFKAYGGQQALEAERKGLTQKVRITSHLAGVFQKELGVTAPAAPALAAAPEAVSRNAQAAAPLAPGRKIAGLY